MTFKRIASALTALACCTSIMTVLPEITDKTYAAAAVSNDFEVTYGGWYSTNDQAELTAVSNEGFNGSRGMIVSGRQSAEDGAASSKGFYLWGDTKYDYSVQVYSETDEVFHISLLYKDMETDKETTVELASEKVKAGEWTEISASYKAPANTYEYLVTITTESTNDFAFDDFKVTAKEKVSAKAAPAGMGLKNEFASYGFRVGNIFNGNTIKNSGIVANILKDCSGVECENETKPDATLVLNGSSDTNVKVSLSRAAAIIDFCVQNGIGFRGHTLVWHSQTPEAFFKQGFNQSSSYVDTNTMNKRMESYIKNMFNAYATQYPTLDLYAYDVCNECISDSNGGARGKGVGNGNSPWVAVYGDNSFIEKAFTYARQYAPKTCKLFYNDYNEYMTAGNKKSGIYNLVKSLYGKGILDGMGMQSHVPANATGFAGTVDYLQAMDDYLGIGCDVQVTELDISLESGKYSLQDQANKYKAIFQHAMEHNASNKAGAGKVTLIQIWGPNDANSWLSSGSNALLYDSNNQPKLAYNTLIGMVPESQWVPNDQLNYGSGTISIPEPEPNEYGWWYQCGFEDGTSDWGDRGGNTVEQSNKEHYVQSNSLFVSGRTSEWMGAIYTLNSRVFKPGEAYSFSAHVKQNSGESVKFMMKLEYTDASGETAYDEIANVTAPDGAWAQLINTEYTIPSDASGVKIYVETESSLTDFYLDECIGAKKGVGIQGEGQPDLPADPSTAIRGDITFDGSIDALDVAVGRSLLTSGSLDAATKKAADADKNGKYEINDLVLIQQYVLGKISEFPTEKVEVDTSAMAQKFSSVKLAESWKKEGENNPLYTQRFGADPGFMVYKDRLYVYTTNDAFEYNGNQMKENSYDVGTINCCSSSDLVNWTDHGAIPVAGRNGRTQGGVASWASCSWAPDACWKTINGKDKFFLYFANSGGGIGVLTADSPTGPWKDPLGHALLTGGSPNCSDVVWMFDPGVMVDDDGTGYLFFGGGVDNRDKANPKTGRCVKLGDDMISLAGTPVTMETPYLFEDSSIIKIGNTYYYSYCSNWNVPGGTNINGSSFGSGDICYMTSNSPLGPWTKSQFAGRVFANTGGQGLDKGGNNHHSIVFFKDKYYVLYHTRVVENRMGINLNYRSPSISECTLSNGKLSCSGSHKGVSQLEALDPYTTVQAETMSSQSKNIKVDGLMDTKVSGGAGEWIKVSGVDFGSGASGLTVKASSKNGAVIKVCKGGTTGEAIAYVEVPAGGSVAEIEGAVCGDASGKTDIYFEFSGDVTFDSWCFS